MPVQIGAKTHNFNDPIGLLSDCHRRVEMFLGALEACSKAIDQPASQETARVLQSALRYFSEAAPKHTADEEESLFPRLRQLHNPEIESALSRLDRLEADHRWASPLHVRLDELGKRYLDIGRLSAAQIDSFRGSVAKLSAMYNEHINLEDQLIFPLAAEFLSQAEKTAIGQEIARRRDVTRL